MKQTNENVCLTFPCGKPADVCISQGDIIRVAYCAKHWELARAEYEAHKTHYRIEWISESRDAQRGKQ